MAEPRFLGGRYELGEMLGHGGMAEVRIGIDRRLGRTVAVKILRTDLATDPTFQARFRREAQSAASLNHPSVVAVYDTGEELVDGVGLPYIVMEYVEGRTLRDVLREGRRILPDRAMEICAEVLEALEYSHRAGIIHRDIKPGNVMLTPNGDSKVMDFGIARAVADSSATMTQTAAVIGTAQYLSPEQARGESVDSRSDIYSTGCLLYELLTGRPPFVGDSPVSVAYQHVREEPRPPSMLDPEVSPEADAITLKALSKKPDDRYQSADEMRQDIVRCLAGQRVAAPVLPPDATARFMPPDEPPTHLPPENWQYDEEQEPPDKGRRVAYILLAIALAFILGVLGFILWQQFFSSTETPVPTLTELTEPQAQRKLEEAGFRLGDVHKEANETMPSGQVFRQSPDANAQAEPRTAVEIWVSTGKPEVTVPDVVGMPLDQARTELSSKGFDNIEEKEDKNSDEAENEVTAVDPPEGTDVSRNTEITLTYSAGLSKVPDVTGETAGVAEATLRSAGFEVATETEPTDEADPGEVYDQIPRGDERVKQGTTVTIFVAEELAPPNLTVSAASSNDVPPAGGETTISVDVSNIGEGDTTGEVSVNVTLPEGVTVNGSAPDGCDTSGSTVTCAIDSISAGSSETLDIPVLVPAGQPNGTLTGSVSVATDGEGNQSGNAAEFTIQYATF